MTSRATGLFAGSLLLIANAAWGVTYYVDASRPDDTGDGLSWATAKQTIQAGVDLAGDGDAVVVTNGVYDSGGAVVHGGLTNRVSITNAITVRSANGPEFAFIIGNGPLGDTAVRCAYLGDDARLEGFTLTNGHTRTSGDFVTEQSGGGVFTISAGMGVVSNCIIIGNAADRLGGGAYHGTIQNCIVSGNSAQAGGGTSYSLVKDSVISGNTAVLNGGGSFGYELDNCIITENSASNGGGTYFCTARNCTIIYNSAYFGGGTWDSVVLNCIVYSNSATQGPGDYYIPELIEFTCTTPDPGNGWPGNITNAPQFVDAANSNFHLLSTSPCIDAGTNDAWMTGATDLDGHQRIINARVDMGAYESISPAISDVARVADEIVVTWYSVSNLEYSVYGATNISHGFNALLQDGISATPPFNLYTDTVDGAEWLSYGVEVRELP